MTQNEYKQLIAHVDMDCFFCACEEKHNPDLRGKPVIVGAIGKRGVVATANYEARKFGLHSAMPGSIAHQKCPDGIYLKSNFALYKAESQAVMEILSSFTDNCVQVSVDEAYLDVTHMLETMMPQQIAYTIKQTIKDKTQLTCSVGVAQAKMVAKIASDMHKPDGYTVITEPTKQLAHLSVKKLPGVGKVGIQRYHKHNVSNIGDLLKLSTFDAIEKLGQQAVTYQQILTGLLIKPLKGRSGRKSISKERTFVDDVDCQQTIHETLHSLGEAVYKQRKYYAYKTVSIKVRYKDFSTFTRDYTLPTMSTAPQDIHAAINILTTHIDLEKQPIRLLGVKLSSLVQTNLVQENLVKYVSH